MEVAGRERRLGVPARASATTSGRRVKLTAPSRRASATSPTARTAPRRSSAGSRHSRPAGVEGAWLEGDLGHGRAYSFLDPDGHRLELFYESERYDAPPERPAGAQEPAAALPGARRRRAPPRPRQLPRASIPARTASSREEHLGLRLTEQIVLDDGTEAGVWLASEPEVVRRSPTRAT